MRTGVWVAVLALSAGLLLSSLVSIPDWPSGETVAYYVSRTLVGPVLGLAGVTLSLRALLSGERSEKGSVVESKPRRGAGWQRPPHDVD